MAIVNDNDRFETYSTMKSAEIFKRNRDEPSESDNSNQQNRKKRLNNEVDRNFGRTLTTEDLFIYRWPLDESDADFYVLQEQICDYLLLKSFKRKYPNLNRRTVDLHEREYLRSENAVSESQCDLGLTALKIDDVLRLISIDYPKKSQEFHRFCQEKRRSLIASTDRKNRRDDLLRSTMDFNSQLQRERRVERRACFDLQSMQIHFPSHRQFRLSSSRTKIGAYPLPILPGQYQDAFIPYQSNELKYMPINTAIFYYPKPLALIQSEPQTVPSDDEKEEEAEEETNLPPSSLCHTCQSVLNDDEDQIVCSHCQHSFHRHCLEIGQDMFNIIKTYSWQCIDCKSCLKCNRSDDEATIMFCDRCDRGYHSSCVGLRHIPDGSWQCSACDRTSPIKAKRGRPPLNKTTKLSAESQ